MTKFDESGLPEPTKYPQMPKVIKMKERIQELMRQATNPDYDGDDGPANELNIEKFAQLIAVECAEICLEMAAKCAGLPGDGALAKDCAYWIKKDFGVEE